MRRLLYLLTALLLTTVLVGCGSEKERGQNRNQDKPQASDKEK